MHKLVEEIFNVDNEHEFNELALSIFDYQMENNPVYAPYASLILKGVAPENYTKIPFLPIEFFKHEQIICQGQGIEEVFLSSGTTGQQSKHLVSDTSVYEQSYLKTFEQFYGNIEDYAVLALLPNYLERKGSSLVYMVADLIQRSKNKKSGFYLNNIEELAKKLIKIDQKGQKTLLIGVSFALMDLIEKCQFELKNTIIMETGGMKGRRKELVRNELHALLQQGFGVKNIHSEYGMTELLSQGYSNGNGVFETPPWMKVITRDPEDALSIQKNGKTGGINIIDLANYNSCAFIATQDLGKVHQNGTFEIIGRFDNSDIRGCNLLVL